VKFDVAKCFPSLPWWALFGVMEEAGIPPPVIRCFRSFYTHLRQRFRYGQVDGAEWAMANGLAQGCPASPDLMNVLSALVPASSHPVAHRQDRAVVLHLTLEPKGDADS